MKDYMSAYRAYDIRSVYDQPIDGIFAYSLGKGVGKYLVDSIGPQATVCFGADGREANDVLITYFLKGLVQAGCTHIINVGLPVSSIGATHTWGIASTAMVYYITHQTFDLGVVFTASHNPAEYVGIKMVDRHASLIPSDFLSGLVTTYDDPGPLSQDECLQIHTLVEAEGNPLHTFVQNRIHKLTILYQDLFSQLKNSVALVVDFSNGSGTAYERRFLEQILISAGHHITFINDHIDSAFSAHPSDTTNPHDYEQLSREVTAQGANLGVMFDGDADRLGIVDEQGEMVAGDFLVALIANCMLDDVPPGQTIVYDITSTNAIPSLVEAKGSIAVPSRVGHRYIKEQFHNHNAIFGGELSGHLLFPVVGGFENPLVALYRVLLACERVGSMKDAVARVTLTYKPPLTNYTVADKEAVMKRLVEYYQSNAQSIDYMDGVRVNFDNWRCLVRPSNTEPKLRVYIEGESQELVEMKKQELEKILCEK